MGLSECLPNVLHAETIEKIALDLLNCLKTLFLSPNIQVTAELRKKVIQQQKDLLKKPAKLLFPQDIYLTLSRRRPLSYRKQSIDLLRKSMNWFLYDNSLRLERVKCSCRGFRCSNIRSHPVVFSKNVLTQRNSKVADPGSQLYTQ